MIVISGKDMIVTIKYETQKIIAPLGNTYTIWTNHKMEEIGDHGYHYAINFKESHRLNSLESVSVSIP